MSWRQQKFGEKRTAGIGACSQWVGLIVITERTVCLMEHTVPLIVESGKIENESETETLELCLFFHSRLFQPTSNMPGLFWCPAKPAPAVIQLHHPVYPVFIQFPHRPCFLFFFLEHRLNMAAAPATPESRRRHTNPCMTVRWHIHAGKSIKF